MKVYISGKITGTNDYIERFFVASKMLKNHGFSVVNPALINSHLPTSTTWDDYMIVSKALLTISDAIFMLKGYERSRGAMLELKWAEDMGINILFE